MLLSSAAVNVTVVLIVIGTIFVCFGSGFLYCCLCYGCYYFDSSRCCYDAKGIMWLLTVTWLIMKKYSKLPIH